ncbi:MAG: hypothetical protein ACYC9W_01105 [Candidatus Limnocylindria bacterium]
MKSSRIAQDIPRAWALATHEQRKRMIWSVFNRNRISSGAIASVRPKPETAVLLAAAVHRSGPDRSPERRCELAGIRVEGIDDRLELVALRSASRPHDQSQRAVGARARHQVCLARAGARVVLMATNTPNDALVVSRHAWTRGEVPCPFGGLPVDDRDIDEELWDFGDARPVGARATHWRCGSSFRVTVD